MATYITFPLSDTTGVAVEASANPDSEIDNYNDGAAPDGYVDCTNEAVALGSGNYYLSLSQSEMNFDYIDIIIKSDDAITQHMKIRTTIGDPLLLATTVGGALVWSVPSRELSTPASYKADVTGINDLSTGITALQADLDNPAQFKADVTNLDAAISTRAPANEYDTQLDANISTRSSHGAPDVSELANISGYIQPMAVEVTQASGAIAIPADFKADVTNLDQSLSTTESNIRGGTQTLETISGLIDGIGAGGGATAQEVWEYASPRSLSTPGDYMAIITGLALESSLLTSGQIASGVWDEVLTAATHNITSSAGRRVRQATSNIIINGTALSSGNGYNQIELNGDASAVDGAYDPAMISIIAGVGLGQTRGILEYEGATKLATVDRNWKVQPNITSEYIISSWPGREHVNEGLAQSGSTNTVTLNALGSPFDDAYKYQTIFIRSGPGEDQSRAIESYNGTTKVATIGEDWDVVPTSDSAYIIIPVHIHSIDKIAEGVWDKTALDYTGATSFGGLLNMVQGLLGHNSYSTFTWDGDDNTRSVVQVYDSAFNAGVHDGASGLIASYSVTGTYTTKKIQTCKQVLN